MRNKDPDHVLENDKLLKIFQGLEGDAEGTKAFLLVSILSFDLPSWIHAADPLLFHTAEAIEYRIRLFTTLPLSGPKDCGYY